MDFSLLRYLRVSAVCTFKFFEIVLNAGFKLLQAALHLGGREILVVVIHGFELAAVYRDDIARE